MKKNNIRGMMLRVISAALSVIVFMVCLSSCSPSAKYQKKVKAYLDSKYGEMTYSLVSCEQNRQTNGRYEVVVYNEDTKETFDVYVYSTIFITDSYSVDYANRKMKSLLGEEIRYEDFASAIENIQWLDRFNDGENNYSFRTVDMNSLSVNDIKSLYSVSFTSYSIPSAMGAANVAYNFCMALKDRGIELEKVNFMFKVDKVDYVLETSTKAAEYYGADYMRKLIKERVESQNSLTFKSVSTISIECTVADEPVVEANSDKKNP